MKLIHLTEKDNLQNILDLGLKINYKKSSDSREKIVMQDLKPRNIDLPEFVSLDNAIYLTPHNSRYEYMRLKKPSKVIVNSKKLDSKLLYCAPATLRNEINEIVYYGCRNNDKAEMERMLASKKLQKTINKYWREFKPFVLYSAKFKGKAEVPEHEAVEVLYFDEIPPQKLLFEA